MSLARHFTPWLVVLLASSARAQTWVPVGPPGGDVRGLARSASDPRVLYLGTTEGVLYRSDDAAGRWQRLTPGFPLTGMSLDNIAATSTGDIFVGYWQVAGNGGGVARSTDGGRNFTVLSGIAGESVRALAVAPSDPRRLVAGTLSGVFTSRNRGDSWQRISPKDHDEIRNVESVAIDPQDPDVVYAGTWHLPWKTLDGGRSWRPISTGMISDSDVFTLTLDSRNPRTVYATACSGIFRSGDAGARWTKVKGIPTSSRRTRAFAQDPERPDRLFAGTTEGLWASDDGGTSWTLRSAKDVVVNAVVPLPGGAVLLGCDGIGVLKGGDSAGFSPANTGFSARFVSSLLFDRARSRFVAAIQSDRQHAGVLGARHVEGPWSKLAPGLEGREVVSLSLDRDTLLAGTDDGLFVLRPEAGSWARLPTTVAGEEQHPRVAEALAPAPGSLLLASDKGLLRSTDAGKTWTSQPLGSARNVSALSRFAGGVLVAATQLGLYRSENLGASWQFDSDGPYDNTVGRLAQSERDPSIVFAATARGLYRSADEGRTWSLCRGLPSGDITGLTIHPNGRTVYAADFARGGLYRSEDTGVNWQAFSSDGLVPDRVWSVFISGGGDERLIAATASGGLHVLDHAREAAPASSR